MCISVPILSASEAVGTQWREGVRAGVAAPAAPPLRPALRGRPRDPAAIFFSGGHRGRQLPRPTAQAHARRAGDSPRRLLPRSVVLGVAWGRGGGGGGGPGVPGCVAASGPGCPRPGGMLSPAGGLPWGPETDEGRRRGGGATERARGQPSGGGGAGGGGAWRRNSSSRAEAIRIVSRSPAGPATTWPACSWRRCWRAP